MFVKKAIYVEQKSRVTSQAANLGYEIPALLYSILKHIRTLIAKAIGREKIMKIHVLFWYFWNLNFKNQAISWDICVNPCVILFVLKSEFQKSSYFVRRMQKMLRDMNGTLQKQWKSLCDFDIFLIMSSKCVVITVISERHVDGTLQK